MNPAYVHLLINHLPSVGLLFAMCGMLVALVLKNNTLIKFNLAFLLVCNALTLPVYFSGEEAEDFVEHQVSKEALEAHEFVAKVTTSVNMVAMGVTLLGGGLYGFGYMSLMKLGVLSTFINLFSLVTLFGASRTGGMIMHGDLLN